ncbi:MAG: O-antigen polymerase, partial [Nitrospirae bacterium]|nr:O-antigen polymerase [Nitrospirota bacterium]
YSIIVTASRKTFLGLIVLIFAWLWTSYKNELKRRPSYFIVIFFLILALYSVTDYMIENTYMGTRFREDIVDNPITERRQGYHRIIFYKEGLKLLMDNPIFGIGLGNFQVYSEFDAESHSEYIEVVSSTGIIGAFLYFSIYILLWRRLTKIKKQSTDWEVSYTAGLLKAGMVMMLVIGFGRPHFSNLLAWIYLSSAIGYAWSQERRLSYEGQLYYDWFTSREFRGRELGNDRGKMRCGEGDHVRY